MFDQDDFDPNSLPVEDDLFTPGDLLTPEEFVGLALASWSMMEEESLAAGEREEAQEFATAIKILKSSYSVRELIDLEAYEKQLRPRKESVQQLDKPRAKARAKARTE